MNMKLALVFCAFVIGAYCALPQSSVTTRALPGAAPNPNDLNIFFQNAADCNTVFDTWELQSGSCTYTNRCDDHSVITQEESAACSIWFGAGAMKIQMAQIARDVGVDTAINGFPLSGQHCTGYQITTDDSAHLFCNKNYNCMYCTAQAINQITIF